LFLITYSLICFGFM